MNQPSRQLDPIPLLFLMLFFITPLLLYMPSLESVVIPKTVFIVVLTCFLLAMTILLPEHRPRSLEEIFTPLDYPVLAVVLTSALSIWLAGESLLQVPAFRLLLSNIVLIYLLVYFFRRRPELIRYSRNTLTVAAVLMAFYVILQDYGLDPMGWAGGVPDWRGKLPGTMGNPNAVAGFSAVLMPTFIFQFFFSRSFWGRLGMGVGLCILWMAMVVTFSVGAWIGIVFGCVLGILILRKPEYKPLPLPVWTFIVLLLVGLFLRGESSEHRSFMAKPLQALSGVGIQGVLVLALLSLLILGAVLLHKRFRLSYLRIGTPLVLLILVVTFYFTPNPWNGRSGSILDQAQASDRWKTGSGARRFIWKTTALMVGDDPVFGIGFGRYFKVHALYQGQLYLNRGTPHDRPTVGKVPQVHNEYYQQMAETGLVGSIAFFWLVLSVIGLWKPAYQKALAKEQETEKSAGKTSQDLSLLSMERAWIFAAILGLGIFMIHALTSFPLRRPSTWLAGAFLLAQIISTASPIPKKSNSATASFPSPSGFFKVIVLLIIAFHLQWAIRPLMANIKLQRFLSPYELSSDRGALLQEAVTWSPGSFEPHFFIAHSFIRSGNYPLAIAHARMALEAHEDLEAHTLIAEAYGAMGDWDKSAKAWDEALKINPCFPPFIEKGIELNQKAGNLYRAKELIQFLKKIQE